MGAVISVLIIWLVTGILVYEGIQRVIYQDFVIDADIMLIISTVGLYVNVLYVISNSYSEGPDGLRIYGSQIHKLRILKINNVWIFVLRGIAISRIIDKNVNSPSIAN